MRGLVTSSRLDSIVDVPIALPQVLLTKATSIVVSVIQLSLGQKLSIGWLGAQLIKVTSGVPDRLNSSLGLVYVGLYTGELESRLPTGAPICGVTINGPFTKMLSPYVERVIYGPNLVKVVAVNNTSNIDADIVVNGVMKLYLTG